MVIKVVFKKKRAKVSNTRDTSHKSKHAQTSYIPNSTLLSSTLRCIRFMHMRHSFALIPVLSNWLRRTISKGWCLAHPLAEGLRRRWPLSEPVRSMRVRRKKLASLVKGPRHLSAIPTFRNFNERVAWLMWYWQVYKCEGVGIQFAVGGLVTRAFRSGCECRFVCAGVHGCGCAIENRGLEGDYPWFGRCTNAEVQRPRL